MKGIKMTEIERKTIQDIKDYVKSLNTPDNKVYQNNELLIMSCFAKAIEIVERNAQLSVSDFIYSFIKDNLSVGLSMDGTSVTIKLFIKNEIISEYTESMRIYKRDVDGLD
jgi:hypothetical protein